MAGSFSIDARIWRDAACQIACLECGQGRPVVFLHGIGSAARSFTAQLAGLAARYRAVAWNAPGYAGSTPLSEPDPDAGHYADRLATWLAGIGIDRCHLVGHSLGGLIAARFAATRPERVHSLTLASVALGHATLAPTERDRLRAGRLDDLDRLGARAMAEQRGPRLLGPHATPVMIASVVDTMAGVTRPGYAQAAALLGGGNVLADIARLAPVIPLAIIFGDADVITPPDNNRRAAAVRSGTTVHAIAGAGHAVYLERPEAFNAALERHWGDTRAQD